MWRANYRGKTSTPGHQHNASMSPISPIRPLTSGCAYIEMFLRHPRSAPRFFFFFFFCAWTKVLFRGFPRFEYFSTLSRPTQKNNFVSLKILDGIQEQKVFYRPFLL